MIHFDSPPKRHARIEIIPMIDVMMFLLVFFVLISINVIPSFGVATNLPSSSTTAKVSLDQPVIVTISKEGRIQVNGHEVEASGVAAQVKELAKGSGEPQVIIKTDGEAVMQQVVDVMDRLRTGGVSKVSIATRARTQG